MKEQKSSALSFGMFLSREGLWRIEGGSNKFSYLETLNIEIQLSEERKLLYPSRPKAATPTPFQAGTDQDQDLQAQTKMLEEGDELSDICSSIAKPRWEDKVSSESKSTC